MRMQQQIHEREQANESKPPAVAHSEWFFPVRYKPGWFNFTKFIPDAVCWVIPDGDDIEIHNVRVFNPEMRGQGIGTEMIRHIREAFPHHHIWVDTWDHSSSPLYTSPSPRDLSTYRMPSSACKTTTQPYPPRVCTHAPRVI